MHAGYMQQNLTHYKKQLTGSLPVQFKQQLQLQEQHDIVHNVACRAAWLSYIDCPIMACQGPHVKMDYN